MIKAKAYESDDISFIFIQNVYYLIFKAKDILLKIYNILNILPIRP